MADKMRDRLIYDVFHSTDEDATDQLMFRWDKMMASEYPEVEITESIRADAKRQAEHTVATVRDNNGYFAISPSGRIELVSPLDIASGWEDYDGGAGDVFQEVLAERAEQIEAHGYTPEHDDAHGGEHLIQLSRDYLSVPEAVVGIPIAAQEVRRRVIKSMAVSLALVELIDRAERVNLAQIVDEGLSELDEDQS